MGFPSRVPRWRSWPTGVFNLSSLPGVSVFPPTQVTLLSQNRATELSWAMGTKLTAIEDL